MLNQIKKLTPKIRKSINLMRGKVQEGENYYHPRFGEVKVEGNCLGGKKVLISVRCSRTGQVRPILVNTAALSL